MEMNLEGTFNQEKALGGAFSVITNLRMELFEALLMSQVPRAQFRRVLLGVRADRNRWSQCVEWTNKKMGMAVGPDTPR